MLSCCKSDIVVEKLQICVETIFCREMFECPLKGYQTPPTNPSHQARHLCDENFFIDDEFFLVLDNPLE